MRSLLLSLAALPLALVVLSAHASPSHPLSALTQADRVEVLAGGTFSYTVTVSTEVADEKPLLVESEVDERLEVLKVEHNGVWNGAPQAGLIVAAGYISSGKPFTLKVTARVKLGTEAGAIMLQGLARDGSSPPAWGGTQVIVKEVQGRVHLPQVWR